MAGNNTTANPSKLAYVGRQPGRRDSDSWFTPPLYIESVCRVLGGIGLDPFSSVEANRIVKAKRFFTAADDAFPKQWKAATVFMNPPYSGGLCRAACHKFVQEFKARHFARGIVLVNNVSETRFFQELLCYASAVCFTDHRISFWNADDKAVSGNTRGQAFLFFGDGRDRFRAEFSKHGAVLYV